MHKKKVLLGRSWKVIVFVYPVSCSAEPLCDMSLQVGVATPDRDASNAQGYGELPVPRWHWQGQACIHHAPPSLMREVTLPS